MADAASPETCADPEGETSCESTELRIKELTRRSRAGDSPQEGSAAQISTVSGVVSSPTPPISRHASAGPRGTSESAMTSGADSDHIKVARVAESRPIFPRSRPGQTEKLRRRVSRQVAPISRPAYPTNSRRSSAQVF